MTAGARAATTRPSPEMATGMPILSGSLFACPGSLSPRTTHLPGCFSASPARVGTVVMLALSSLVGTDDGVLVTYSIDGVGFSIVASTPDVVGSVTPSSVENCTVPVDTTDEAVSHDTTIVDADDCLGRGIQIAAGNPLACTLAATPSNGQDTPGVKPVASSDGIMTVYEVRGIVKITTATSVVMVSGNGTIVDGLSVPVKSSTNVEG